MTIPKKLCFAFGACVAVLSPACRETPYAASSTQTQVGQGYDGNFRGFYLINEGNMGSNKASIDYMDLTSGIFVRNIYAERNPNVVKELGDVANDVLVYGHRLYATINCSHKVEVMDAATAIRIGQIDIPNCRSLAAWGDYVYVSSYVSPNAQIDPHAPLGAVYRIDVNTLAICGRTEVGYQPEEMAVAAGKLYVANSGGYRVPDYDSRLSVIDLASFELVGHIDVAVNLHRVRTDSRGLLYVSSRGDYANTPSALYVVDPATDQVVDRIDVPVSDMWVHGDSLYAYASEVNEATSTQSVSYCIVDLPSRRVVDTNIIKDGTDASIKMPHGIAVNPDNGDIYITDARNYVSSGRLLCYSPEGRLQWSVQTGDIPSRFAFLPRY